MSKQTINIGASPNDGTGTPLRTSFDYTNQNFTEIYTALGGGVALPGATTQVIFNDGGTNLAGDAGLVYNKTTDALTVAGLVTAGSATITGALTVDTSTLVVDPTNNRVGIGTATPGAPLDIFTNNLADAILIRGNDNANVRIRMVNSGAGGEEFALSAGIPSASNSSFVIRSVTAASNRYIINQTGEHAWATNAGTAMTLNSSGNVGIGVTPSAWGGSYKALQLQSTARSIASTGAGSGDLTVAFNAIYDSTDSRWEYAGTGDKAGRYSQTGSGNHRWFVSNTAGTAGNEITDFASAAMTLDASGNLLVASGVVRAAGRTQIGAGYIGDISGTGNNRGIFFSSTGLFPADGSGNSSDNTYDLGSATYRWDTVFAGTGTINTSDRNEKQDISDLSASEKRVASSIKQLVKKYRFKDAVASKGENARIHVGWIAQDIQSAFAAEGLDASNYGMFCSDTWEENGVEKTRLGLRYDEVLAFVVSAI
jgi:hypothetical protein